MTIDLDKLNADLTAAVQGPLTAEGWRQITRLIGGVYPRRSYDQFRELPAEQDAQLEQEVLAPLRAALDARWPATLRVVGINHHPRTRSIGRILELSFRSDEVISFGHAHGKKYTRQITKKLCAEMAPLWLDGMSCEGFILDSVSSAPLLLLNSLLDHNPTPLRHLNIQRLDIADHKKPDAATAVLQELADLIIDRCGQTLESLGLSHNDFQAAGSHHAAFYNRLLQRADKLPALRSLEIDHEPYGHPDFFTDLMAAPALDKLQQLSFPSGITHARARTLTARTASLNLQKIGAGWVNNPNRPDLLDLRAFIHAPNLANVEVWDLRDGSRPDGEWESEEAAMWAAERAGRADEHAKDLLDADVVDMVMLDAAQTRAALFDGDTLRPAPSLKAIRVKAIDDADLARLIDAAPTAWPALECLIFMHKIRAQEQLDRIAASPLLQTLRFFDWNDREDPARYTLGAVLQDKKAFKAARLALIARILDPATPPFIAYRLWRIVQEVQTHTKADRELIAKAIGLPAPYAADYKLLRDCDTHIIARLGGKRPLLTNGPTHADTLDNPLLWPDPHYTVPDHLL